MECRVWSVKCGVYVKCKVWSVKCKEGSVVCRVWRVGVECKVRSVECGV